MRRAERGCARAAEQVLRTHELIPSGPVAESELMVARNLSTLSGVKYTEFRSSWLRLGRVGTESKGLGTKDLDGD